MSTNSHKFLRHKGVVVQVKDGNTAVVEIPRTTACGNCSSKGHCGGGSSSEEANFLFTTTSLTNPVKGEVVDVLIPEKAAIRGVVMIYVIPLVLMVATAIIMDALLPQQQLGTAFSSLGVAVAYFVWLKWHEKRQADEVIILRPEA